jgi:hypothetical protein
MFFIIRGFDKGSELGHRDFGFTDIKAVVYGDFMGGPFIAVGRVRAHLECAGRDLDEMEFRARDFNAGF